MTYFVAKHSCALSPAPSTVKREWPRCVCGCVSNLWIISQALSLGSSGFGARYVWRCKRHERISFLSPPCYHTVYDQMAPLSKHLGHPCLRACAKECLLYYEQCPVFRECRMFRKVCTQSSSSLSANYDSLQRKLYGSQLIKSQTSRRWLSTLAVEKAVSDGQKAGKDLKRTTAFQRRSDSRTFGSSKFPKRVGINPLNAWKRSQWESPIMTHLALCHFLCSQPNQGDCYHEIQGVWRETHATTWNRQKMRKSSLKQVI